MRGTPKKSITSLQLERVARHLSLDETRGIWRVSVGPWGSHRVCDLIQAVNVASLPRCKDAQQVIDAALTNGSVVGEGVYGPFFIGLEGGAE